MSAPARRELPRRRPNTSARISAGAIAAHATVGFDAHGRPAEIFLRPTGGAKSGSEVDFLLDDLAVVVSVALQHGVPASALARSVSRTPDGTPTTIAGAAAALLAELEEGML